MSELLQLQLALLSANALTIDYPIHKADEAGSADDIAECDRDEVMDNARYCNKGGVEASRDTTVNGLQPGQGQKIHVCDAVLEAGRDECGGRQYQTDNLIGDRTTCIRKPNPRANEHVAQDALDEQREHVGADLCDRRIQYGQPDAAAVHIEMM